MLKEIHKCTEGANVHNVNCSDIRGAFH